MATIKTDDNEQQKKQTPGVEGQTLTSSVPAPQAAPGGAPGAPAPRKPTQSGSFVDVGQYLKARTPDQLKRQAQRVTQGLSQQAQEQAGQIRQEGSQFAGGIQRVQDTTAGKGLGQVDAAEFQRQLQGRYEPTGQFRYSGQQDLNKLQQDIAGTETARGKVEALKGLVKRTGGPRLTQGSQALSGVLLNRPQETRSLFGQLRQQAPESIQAAQRDVGSQIAQAQEARRSSIEAAQRDARKWYDAQRAALSRDIGTARQGAQDRFGRDLYNQFQEQWRAKNVEMTPEMMDRRASLLEQVRRESEAQGRLGLDVERDAEVIRRMEALNALANVSGLQGIYSDIGYQGPDQEIIRRALSGIQGRDPAAAGAGRDPSAVGLPPAARAMMNYGGLLGIGQQVVGGVQAAEGLARQAIDSPVSPVRPVKEGVDYVRRAAEDPVGTAKGTISNTGKKADPRNW